MKKTFRQAMLSTICMLVVAVISLTGVTYAWFTQGTQAQVQSFDVNVQTASGNLMIGIANGTAIKWGNTITPFTSAAGTLTPVSTIGETVTGAVKFFSAAVDQNDAAKITDVAAVENQTFTVGETTYTNYIMFDFYIDNSTNGTTLPVYLDATSAVTGTTKSELASRIAIVPQGVVAAGSTVVDTTNFDRNGSSSIIFEPNQKTHTTSGQAYQAASGLDRLDGVYAYNGIKAAGSIGTSYGRYTDNTVLGTVTTKAIGDDTPIVTVPANSYQMVTVYIWLEGQDADCLNDVAGAAFNVDLKLTLTKPGTDLND